MGPERCFSVSTCARVSAVMCDLRRYHNHDKDTEKQTVSEMPTAQKRGDHEHVASSRQVSAHNLPSTWAYPQSSLRLDRQHPHATPQPCPSPKATLPPSSHHRASAWLMAGALRRRRTRVPSDLKMRPMSEKELRNARLCSATAL